MEISQIYETTVVDRINGYALRLLVISDKNLAASIRQGSLPAKAAIESVLGLQGVRAIPASALPQAITGMLLAESEEATFQELQASAVLDYVMQTPAWPTSAAAEDPEVLGFAEHVAFSNLVPFEDSPLGLVSLASKAASLSKNGIALGAFVGVIAGGATPLLLLTVPTGIILCTTAMAFAKFIDAKRGEIFSDLLGVRPGDRDEAPPTPQGAKPESVDGMVRNRPKGRRGP